MQLLLKRCKSEIVWKNATVKYLLRALKSFRQPQMCLNYCLIAIRMQTG